MQTTRSFLIIVIALLMLAISSPAAAQPNDDGFYFFKRYTLVFYGPFPLLMVSPEHALGEDLY